VGKREGKREEPKSRGKEIMSGEKGRKEGGTEKQR
jgi:hypothetical protein